MLELSYSISIYILDCCWLCYSILIGFIFDERLNFSDKSLLQSCWDYFVCLFVFDSHDSDMLSKTPM